MIGLFSIGGSNVDQHNILPVDHMINLYSSSYIEATGAMSIHAHI